VDKDLHTTARGIEWKETSMGSSNEPNVAAAMQEVRRRVREQQEKAAPELRNVPVSRGLVSQERLDGAMGELARAAREVNLRWQVHESPFVSHIPLLGPLITRFREAWNSVACKWHVRRILQQQLQFNHSVAQLALSLETLGSELEAMDHSIHALVRHVDENLGGQLKDLEELYRGLLAQLSVTEDSDLEPRSEPMRHDAVRQLPAFPYRDFSRRFGASDITLRGMFGHYLEFFRGCQRVAELGCGRGVFLEMLRENDIGAYGVDIDADAVRLCRGKGLEAIQGDAVEHLRSLDSESLDGVFAAQLVEHLDAAAAWELMGLCYRQLRPGCYLVLETPNTRSLFVMACTYFRDPTHRSPVHPETWEFLARSQGFSEVQLRFSNPPPGSLELAMIEAEAAEAPLRDQLAVLNRNMERLNQVVFDYQNVIVIARK
jgi:SAM-dependent methyltransferase